MRARLDEQDGAHGPVDGPDRTHPPDRPVAMRAQILRLQRHAGNRAVASLLRPRPVAVQRRVGWPEATGANKTITKVGNLLRVPLADLPVGNQAESPDPAKSDEKAGEASGGRAIVLVHPAIVTDDPKKAVEVLLHLHGLTNRRSEPFAGWRENNADPVSNESDAAKKAVRSRNKTKLERWQRARRRDRSLPQPTPEDVTNPLAGKVRDTERDRIGEQLEQATGSDPQVMAILPQGTGSAMFGNESDEDFDPDGYVREVFKQLVTEAKVAEVKAKGLKFAAVPDTFSIILSAHSAGGRTVASVLKRPTSHVRGLVLLDAINSNKQRAALVNWIGANCRMVARLLKLPMATDEMKQAAIAALPGFRGYFEKALYGDDYAGLQEEIEKRVRGTFKKVFGKEKVPADYLDQVLAKFDVIEAKGVSHDRLIGEPTLGGSDNKVAPLEDALRNRDKFVAPAPPGP